MKDLLLSIIAKAYAAPTTGSDSIISKPAGTGILPGAGVEGSDIQSSVVFTRIIPFLISWAINLAVALSVVAIILGGYMYLTSYGDSEKKDKAVRTLVYAVIGLVIAMTAYGVVAIVTSIRIT